jgi:class 3 adenylate cyclase
MRAVEGVGTHAGIHHGVAVFRDGDYFVRAVNLAARLLGAADAGEALATEHVATATPDYAWQHRGRSPCEASPSLSRSTDST